LAHLHLVSTSPAPKSPRRKGRQKIYWEEVEKAFRTSAEGFYNQGFQNFAAIKRTRKLGGCEIGRA